MIWWDNRGAENQGTINPVSAAHFNFSLLDRCSQALCHETRDEVESDRLPGAARSEEEHISETRGEKISKKFSAVIMSTGVLDNIEEYFGFGAGYADHGSLTDVS